MPSDFPPNWAFRPLEECMEAIIDYRGKTPTKTGSGVPLITAKVVKNGRIEEPNEFIAESDYESWMRRGMPKAGDVLVTTEAPLGEVAQLDRRKVALAQRIIALRGKAGLMDNRFLKYALLSEFVRDQLFARSSGTTVSGIRQSELRQVELAFPSFTEQRAIACVLGALDDKIELNRRMNATLEGLARAVFRSWFVDFDPVVAKAAGRRPVGMTADTAALFPDTFEDSPLGPIPKGWRATKLDTFAHLVSGGTPSKGKAEYWNGNIPWVSAKDMKQTLILDAEDHLTAEGAKNGTRTIGEECTLVLVRGMTLHKDVPICFTAEEVAFNQDVKGIVPKDKLHRYFVFMVVLGAKDDLLAGVDAASHGTGRINTETLRNVPCVEPPEPILSHFTRVVQPLLRRLIANERQAAALTALRDALLPRLLSGELRLRDAERMVGDVA